MEADHVELHTIHGWKLTSHRFAIMCNELDCLVALDPKRRATSWTGRHQLAHHRTNHRLQGPVHEEDQWSQAAHTNSATDERWCEHTPNAHAERGSKNEHQEELRKDWLGEYLIWRGNCPRARQPDQWLKNKNTAQRQQPDTNITIELIFCISGLFLQCSTAHIRYFYRNTKPN